MAGVAELLCDEGDQVYQLDQFDPFGFNTHYQKTRTFKELKDVINEAQKVQSKFDKIVIHDYSEFVSYFPKDKVILMFHGTKLRNMDDFDLLQIEGYKSFVTTTDLLNILPKATYLPVPVDTAHFSKREVGMGWVAINRGYQRDIIEKTIKEKYPDTYYHERNTIIPYADMPNFLSRFQYYVDWKFTYDKPIPITLPDPSSTGIQALSLGLTVYNSEGNILPESLLEKHNRFRVRDRFKDAI